MTQRYFTPVPIVGDRATLAGPEAHHLAHVMRAKAGDEVALFDGSGAEFAARVERVGRASIELAVLSRRDVDRELPFALHLGVALPKGDRQRWLVEKAVELGATSLTPLRTERGVAQPSDEAAERLRRTVIEASKQCGRNRLLEIRAATSWPDFVDEAPHDAWRLMAHPGGEPCEGLLRGGSPAPSAGAVLAIGPEGGFSDAEVDCALQAGWRAVDLGPRILRVETAAICLAALVAISPNGPGAR